MGQKVVPYAYGPIYAYGAEQRYSNDFVTVNDGAIYFNDFVNVTIAPWQL